MTQIGHLLIQISLLPVEAMAATPLTGAADDTMFGVAPDSAPVCPIDVAMATGLAMGGGGGGGSMADGMNPAILLLMGLVALPIPALPLICK